MEQKTNVMRILDAQRIEYHAYSYPAVMTISGLDVATMLDQDPSHVFKTLVTVGASKRHYVFVIPVTQELSLKKSASVVGEKSIEMLKSKELLPLTGYIHGGCSPIGMKKNFSTVLDETVLLNETIMFSAGKIGFQVEMTPDDLKKVIPFETADLTV